MRLTTWQDQCSESVEAEAALGCVEEQGRSNEVEVVAVDSSFQGFQKGGGR